MFHRAALPLLLLPALALAQAPPAEPGRDPAARARDQAATRKAELDRLFDMLRDASDQSGAQFVEMRIRAIWQRDVSPAASLLMRRGMRNLQANVPEEALEDLDAAIILQPEAADLFLARARCLAALGNRVAAAQDLQEALRLEPRHFGALAQLAELQEEGGDAAGALRTFDAALALHPRMQGGAERRRELQRRAEGDAL